MEIKNKFKEYSPKGQTAPLVGFEITKICRKCGQELPLTAFNTSVSKYIVGGEVKAVHESIRNICKGCQFPKGWHLKYKLKLLGI